VEEVEDLILEILAPISKRRVHIYT